jgi:hypothetical protein
MPIMLRIRLLFIVALVSTAHAACISRCRLEAYCATDGSAVAVTDNSGTADFFGRNTAFQISTNYYFVSLDVFTRTQTCAGITNTVAIGATTVISVVARTGETVADQCSFFEGITSTALTLGTSIGSAPNTCVVLSTHTYTDTSSCSPPPTFSFTSASYSDDILMVDLKYTLNMTFTPNSISVGTVIRCVVSTQGITDVYTDQNDLVLDDCNANGITHAIEHTLTQAEVCSGTVMRSEIVYYEPDACNDVVQPQTGVGECAVVGSPNDRITMSSAILGCFPEDALVTMADDTLRRMDTLAVGDSVRCLRGATLSHCRVTTFFDRVPSTSYNYVQLTTETTTQMLWISKLHLMYVAPATNSSACREVDLDDTRLNHVPHDGACFTFAERVSVGDRVALSDDLTSLVMVTSVGHATKRGVYAPVVDGGGRFFVNGVLVSSVPDCPLGEALCMLGMTPLTQQLDTRATEDIVGLHPYVKQWIPLGPLLRRLSNDNSFNVKHLGDALEARNASGDLSTFADVASLLAVHLLLQLPSDSILARPLAAVSRTLLGLLGDRLLLAEPLWKPLLPFPGSVSF